MVTQLICSGQVLQGNTEKTIIIATCQACGMVVSRVNGDLPVRCDGCQSTFSNVNQGFLVISDDGMQ